MKLIDSIDDTEREQLIISADGFQGRFDEVEEYIDERISYLDDIEDIELYRVVFLDNIESLNTLELGNHWTPDLYSLDDHFLEYLQHECSGETISGTPFILKATYNRKSINFNTTLYQNLLNPDENEIFIDNKNDYLYQLEYKELNDQNFTILDTTKISATNFLNNKKGSVNKPIIELKTISFDKLYHTGTLNINNKKEYNLEGCNGLSVSNLSDTWSQICNHTCGNNYTLTKENNNFLNFHKLTKSDYNSILEWGVDHNYLKETIIYKYTYYDDEMESEMYMTFHSLEEALEECDETELTSESGYLATEKFTNINGIGNKDNIDLITVIYVEKETDLDGVFWNDKTDILRLSAPRGIILQNNIKNWNINMKKPNIDFYNKNIEKCINQYESLTFNDVHGASVENEIKADARVLDIGCGTGRDANYLASSGRKVVAIDPSNEMISYAKQNNSHENIEYLQSELPTLKNVTGKFDFVLMSAVWMHLDSDIQKESLKLLKNILKKNGKMMILLRNGEFSDGRESYPFISNDFDVLKEDLNLSSKMLSGTKEDLLNRTDVSWSKLLISRNDKVKHKNKMVK